MYRTTPSSAPSPTRSRAPAPPTLSSASSPRPCSVGRAMHLNRTTFPGLKPRSLSALMRSPSASSPSVGSLVSSLARPEAPAPALPPSMLSPPLKPDVDVDAAVLPPSAGSCLHSSACWRLANMRRLASFVVSTAHCLANSSNSSSVSTTKMMSVIPSSSRSGSVPNTVRTQRQHGSLRSFSCRGVLGCRERPTGAVQRRPRAQSRSRHTGDRAQETVEYPPMLTLNDAGRVLSTGSHVPARAAVQREAADSADSSEPPAPASGSWSRGSDTRNGSPVARFLRGCPGLSIRLTRLSQGEERAWGARRPTGGRQQSCTARGEWFTDCRRRRAGRIGLQLVAGHHRSTRGSENPSTISTLAALEPRRGGRALASAWPRRHTSG